MSIHLTGTPAKIVSWFIHRKDVRKFEFFYEESVIDDELITQTFVRQYIQGLQEAVQARIEHLTKEYKL